MLQEILVGSVAGLAFLVLDGVLNANSVPQRPPAAHQRFARPSMNAPTLTR